MRLKLALCTLAVLLVSSLIGCGSGSSSSFNTPPPPSSPQPSLVSITVSSSSSSLAVGKSEQLTATGKYSDGSSKNVTSKVTWSSSSSAIATVSSSGVVTGIKGGTVTISAKEGSIGSTAGLTVNAILESVSVAEVNDQYSANVGSALQFSATATYNDGTSQNVTSSAAWTSTATAIAKLNGPGDFTALSAGTATIQASFDGMVGSAVVHVNALVSLTSIAISPNPGAVNVASSQQLTATDTYSDGSKQNISSTVVWQISNTTKASITSAGLVTGIKGGQVTVTATSGSVSNSIQLTVSAVLQSIVLNPPGPAIVIGNQQQFTATGNYNDGSVQDLTSTAIWNSSDATKATVNAGAATGVAVGPVTISASAAGVNGSTALNVVASVYSTFSGGYAFTLSSKDSRGPAFFAGAINADGNGNITGVEDSNTAAGVMQNVAVTGTYVIYPDGRGNIVFNANQCHPSGITLRVMLSAGGTAGSLSEFDNFGVANGTLAQQNAAALNAAGITGNYVFSISGIGSGNTYSVPAPVGDAGIFSANGAGAISSGEEDLDENGTISAHVSLLSSAYSVGANGRGALQLITASGTVNYVIYVIDSTKLNLISSDPAPADAVLGVAELQTNTVYGASTVSGSYAFLLNRPLAVPSGQSSASVEYGDFGYYAFDGVSSVTGWRDNIGVAGGFSISGTYAMDSSGSGRGTVTIYDCATPAGCTDERMYVVYQVSTTKLILLQTYALPGWVSTNPLIGEADLQPDAPYTDGSVAGNYVVHQANPIASFSENLLLLSFDGNGNIGGIVDQWQAGGMSSTVVVNPFYIYAINNLGAGTIELTTPVGTQDYRCYVVSPQKAWFHAVNPDGDGSIDQQ